MLFVVVTFKAGGPVRQINYDYYTTTCMWLYVRTCVQNNIMTRDKELAMWPELL